MLVFNDQPGINGKIAAYIPLFESKKCYDGQNILLIPRYDDYNILVLNLRA
jgi:hypothetical protein